MRVLVACEFTGIAQAMADQWGKLSPVKYSSQIKMFDNGSE